MRVRFGSVALFSFMVACAPSPAAPAAAPAGPPANALGTKPTPPAIWAPPVVDGERLRAFAATRSFTLGAPRQMTPTPDGHAVLFLRSSPRDPKQSLFETDLVTGGTREFLSPDALLHGDETVSAAERARRERLRVLTTGFTSFELSEDGEHVILTLSGRLFVLVRATGKTRELPTGGEGTEAGAVIDPHLSHDGHRVAYVRGHDIFAIDVDGNREIQVTHGGSESLSHGVAEFIAQEELDRSRGFWWSPDDTKILYEEADTSKLERLAISDPAHPERIPDITPYPRAGTANASLRFGVVSSRSGPTTWVTYDHEGFPYVPTVIWDKGAPPTLYVLDRAQKNGALFAVDPQTGKTTTLLREHDDAWLNVDPSVPRWLSDGGTFLWSSEKSGAYELELRDRSGGAARMLLGKERGYRELVHVDEKKRVAYAIASTEPSESGLYAVPLDGSAIAPLYAHANANVEARFGTMGPAFAVRETFLAAMPRFTARSTDGGEERAIPMVMEEPAVLPAPELTKIGPDETRVAIVRPRSFASGKRYPVIDSAYAGPHANVAIASALRFVLAQWIADRADAIVVSIDARGTPGRGRAWERALLDKVGSVPLEGHVATLSALGALYPEMDMTRVGVFGWSYGGYFAALAALTRPDVYRVAAAAAPVAEWKDYDTCYTERYLGLPETNKAAYDAASLLTAAREPIESFPPRPLLIVHGTADDNVYFFNSLKLVDALERANRPVEFFPVMGMTHVPRDPDRVERVFSRIASFLGEKLHRP
jgi:dipeptidyl-peptidase-4